jgi:TetR/AcrR family transcriptional regulator
MSLNTRFELREVLRSLPTSIAEKLSAGAALFAQSGLEGTTMEDIARATGIPRATLYYYFEGKEDLFAYLVKLGLQAVEREVARALETEGSAADQLAEVIKAQIRVMNRDPEVARAMFAELGRAERMPHVAAAVDAAYSAPVASLLAAGAADQSMRDVEDVHETAMAIFGAVVMAGYQYLVRDRPVPERTVHRLVQLALHGIGEGERQ